MHTFSTTVPFQGAPNGQPAQLVILQTIVVQPVPAPLQQALPAQPGAFQAALEHASLDASLFEREASQVKAPGQEDMQEPGAPRQPSQVVIHTPAAASGKAEGKQQPAPATHPPADIKPTTTTPLATNQASTTRTSSGSCLDCCDCSDPATQYVLCYDDGACAAAINACATGVLRTCQALARLPGAARDCLPSSQALHQGCDSLLSAAGQCCEGFGRCLEGGAGLCVDIITCPCTTCGQICQACCDGLGSVDCNCCDGCNGCDCCCCCCDGGGCDCNC